MTQASRRQRAACPSRGAEITDSPSAAAVPAAPAADRLAVSGGASVGRLRVLGLPARVVRRAAGWPARHRRLLSCLGMLVLVFGTAAGLTWLTWVALENQRAQQAAAGSGRSESLQDGSMVKDLNQAQPRREQRSLEQTPQRAGRAPGAGVADGRAGSGRSTSEEAPAGSSDGGGLLAYAAAAVALTAGAGAGWLVVARYRRGRSEDGEPDAVEEAAAVADEEAASDAVEEAAAVADEEAEAGPADLGPDAEIQDERALEGLPAQQRAAEVADARVEPQDEPADAGQERDGPRTRDDRASALDGFDVDAAGPGGSEQLDLAVPLATADGLPIEPLIPAPRTGQQLSGPEQAASEQFRPERTGESGDGWNLASDDSVPSERIFDRRANGRVPYVQPAWIWWEGANSSAAVQDLSLTGLRCRLDEAEPAAPQVPPGLGDQVRIFFPVKHKTVKVTAHVHWREHGAEGLQVGVEFLDLAAKDLELIRELLIAVQSGV